MKKNRRIHIIILLSLITNFIKAQEIYPYEKQITNNPNFISTDIETKNIEENISIKGTLIEPKTDYKQVVIIVPGSSKDTRNSHYKLAEKLIQNNIAVFRYDERGCGLSTGEFNTVSYTINDITKDLEYVYKNIKSHNRVVGKKIGVLGHSLGGMATIGLLEKNLSPDFFVQWATPVQKKGEFIKYQLISGVNKFENELIYNSIEEKLSVIDKINNIIFENKNDSNLVLIKKIRKISKEINYTKKNYKRFTYANFSSAKELIKKDFENTYKNCNQKLLYIIGENDRYVDSEKETKLLKSFNNSNIEINIVENLNHYLQNGSENIESLYEIENNASDKIINWIKKQ